MPSKRNRRRPRKGPQMNEGAEVAAASISSAPEPSYSGASVNLPLQLEQLSLGRTSSSVTHQSQLPKPEVPKFIPWTGALGFFNYSPKGDLLTSTVNVDPKYMQETSVIGLNCERVGVGPEKECALARVCIVNRFGYCLYDTFVKPDLPVTDYRTERSGVCRKDLEKAPSHGSVVNEVFVLLKGKIVVGHSVNHDFEAIGVSHPEELTRDTAKYYKTLYGWGKSPALKTLTKLLLKREIQEGTHCSITNTQATVALYLMRHRTWEKSLKKAKEGADILNPITLKPPKSKNDDDKKKKPKKSWNGSKKPSSQTYYSEFNSYPEYDDEDDYVGPGSGDDYCDCGCEFGWGCRVEMCLQQLLLEKFLNVLCGNLPVHW